MLQAADGLRQRVRQKPVPKRQDHLAPPALRRRSDLDQTRQRLADMRIDKAFGRLRLRDRLHRPPALALAGDIRCRDRCNRWRR